MIHVSNPGHTTSQPSNHDPSDISLSNKEQHKDGSEFFSSSRPIFLPQNPNGCKIFYKYKALVIVRVRFARVTMT
jgi:hypothetical protein